MDESILVVYNLVRFFFFLIIVSDVSISYLGFQSKFVNFKIFLVFIIIIILF